MNKDYFRAIDGWLDRFKSRFGISFLNMSGFLQKLSADESVIEAFKLKLKQKIQAEGKSPAKSTTPMKPDLTGVTYQQRVM